MAVTLNGGTEARTALPYFLGQQASVSANDLLDDPLQWLSALMYPARVQLLLLLANSRSLRTKMSKGVYSFRLAAGRGSPGKYRYTASTACAMYKQPFSFGIGSFVFVCTMRWFPVGCRHGS